MDRHCLSAEANARCHSRWKNHRRCTVRFFLRSVSRPVQYQREHEPWVCWIRLIRLTPGQLAPAPPRLIHISKLPKMPFHRHSRYASTPETDRSDLAVDAHCPFVVVATSHHARSVRVVPPDFDGLLRAPRCRFVAPCSRS
jgi:hypothetical protein